MIDYSEVKQKVDKLESDAYIIEASVKKFFNALEIDKNGYYPEWKSPTGPLETFHQELILWYESWYNQSHILIQTYYPKKELEFQGLHDGKSEIHQGPDPFHPNSPVAETKKVTVSYGISELLHFNKRVRNLYKPETERLELIQHIIGLFSTQQGILIAIPEVLHLCKSEISKEETISKLPSTPPQQNFFLNATGIDQSSQTTIIIQNFSQIKDFIEKNIENAEDRQELLNQVRELETTQKITSYSAQYQKFMATLADHVTVFYPVLQFLLQYMQNIPK
jgi:hypothetical protein